MRSYPVMPPPAGALRPGEKLRLAAEIAGLYGVARMRLRRGNFPNVLERMRSEEVRVDPPEDSASRLAVGRALGSVTSRMLTVLPGDGRCLTQSLVMTGLLTRRGIDSKLVLAVYPGEQLAAHAWVEYNGSALLEPAAPPLERLTEL